MIIHDNNKDSNKCINSYYFIILTKEIMFRIGLHSNNGFRRISTVQRYVL